MKPFEDWEENDIIKHKMSMEWWKQKAERKKEIEELKNFWMKKLDNGKESGLSLSGEDCKKMLYVFSKLEVE